MNILEFKEKLKDFVAFNLNDIRKIDAGFDLRRLNEWQEKGYIKMIRRGYYAFSNLTINESVLFLLANKIYTPSYVSLEMALSHFNLIPEAVYGLTSVSSRKTNHFKTDFGEFIYRHIKPQLMFGYQLINYDGQNFKIAEPEKAILDYFYLNADLNAAEDFDGLRFNGNEFREQTDKDKLQSYLITFGNKRLEKRFNKFLKYINYD
jgi:predicted transcriptional regulator of viral defense system